MKILIIIDSLKYGGAEKQAVVDANSLIDCGHHVTIVYYKKGDLMNLLAKGVNQHQIKSKNLALASLQIFVHLLLNRYDIVHSHMFWAEIVSILPAKLTGHKIVFNEHGLAFWRSKLYVLTFRFISFFANKIITSCDAVKKIRIERELVKKEKVRTVYNSFDIENKDVKEDLPEFLLNNKEFIIGFVGRFDKIKRIELFIDLAEYLKNFIPHFKILAVGDGEERRIIEYLIKKNNLENYFYLTGYSLNPGRYYKVFDVFVLPSKMEAFPVSLLEAGSYGVPAIAFDVGGNSEIIQSNISGYVVPNNNVKLLANKILFIYNNPKLHEEMGIKAKKIVQANFSVEKRVKILEKLYNNLKNNI